MSQEDKTQKDKPKYIPGQWEDLEEDNALRTLRELLEKQEKQDKE